MKKVKKLKESSFFKAKFVQICRWLGYEIIDQNSYPNQTQICTNFGLKKLLSFNFFTFFISFCNKF
jgi:hypothetical protein